MYAYYSLFKFKIMPWEYAELNETKRATLIAMIQLKIEDEKREAKKLRK